MDLIPALTPSADALQANRLAMDVIAQNIANAHTTKGADGKAYQRQQVVFASYLDAHGQQGVRVDAIERDTSPGQRIHNPAHPHADAEGMVALPNVKTAMEMVDLITTSRAYEANLTVLKTSRQMAQQALAIGRQ